MIDLSKFVDKEVFVTFRSGDVIEASIIKNTSPEYPYICYNYMDEEGSYTYTQEGFYSKEFIKYSRDIVDIQLKQQKTMALSDKTIERLAGALALEAVQYIQQSEEFIQFLTEQLTVFLKEKMGEMDNDVAVEIIGSLIADHIALMTVF